MPGKSKNKQAKKSKIDEAVPKTFKDPISLTVVKKLDGIQLNKQWYAKKGLQNWINTGKNTIPHSRRTLTPIEIDKIFTNRNGIKIPRKTNIRPYENIPFRNNNNSPRSSPSSPRQYIPASLFRSPPSSPRGRSALNYRDLNLLRVSRSPTRR